MDVDLSIVKKERMDLVEDYGNILDNFTVELDYKDFSSTSTISCNEEEDVNVDWLSSFFDEPTQGNMSGLNPALSDISDSGTTVTSINCSPDILLESYPTFSEDYDNAIPSLCNDDSSLDKFTTNSPSAKLSPTTTMCSDNNPFLSQIQDAKDIDLNSLKKDKSEFKAEKKLNYSANNKDKLLNDTMSTVMTSLIQTKTNHDQTVEKSENKPPQQQKLLLFMNTPENRAKLAGTNFNIINANLLSKISGQENSNNNVSPNSIKQSMNLMNLKKCIRLNNTVKTEVTQPKNLHGTVSASSVNATLQSIITADQQKEKKVLPIDILNGHTYGISRKDRDSQELDSGYESPSSSSGLSPRSSPIELSERKGNDCSNETIHYIDIPPHERQPFYLSEEEKRTLIMEGLPVPQGLPLNKSEERALKKVRRKIKNKISAQESRRKKKEYMESLEKKVDCYATENNILKKKVGSLEVANRSLILQVQKLQSLVASKITPPANSLMTLQSTELKQEIIDIEQ